ncbi:putative BOI-related E3 ubiquitin-protein ligase 3 [Senna tora]|uniref:Putative BOI-related E3 ubiquitin-protein ligase 3 n=1 Tax=Senna tora TaxID=362788 RepID=A0A834T1U2_9FABA|nr:putative BOI-related E3 ubiquitin-protein ligase 3 [Senna tora]
MVNSIEANANPTIPRWVTRRKRSRDSTNYPILSYPAAATHTHKNYGYFTFLGEEIMDEIHQQQYNIDRLIEGGDGNRGKSEEASEI